jgi:inosine-uridine nucleoside N-ribohydrolase
VHDPTAVFYVLYKNEFEGKKAYIKVDTNGESYGRTNCNFRSESTNGFVCNKINVKRFWE